MDKGADANAKDRDGIAALMIASYNGNEEIVKLREMCVRGQL